MASHALELPELVGLVFQNLESDVGRSTLASCLRVNRTWFYKAARILWSRCGNSDLDVGEFEPPGVRHLAALHIFHRAHLYSVFIECLYFDVGIRNFDPLSRAKIRKGRYDESKYIPLLREMYFPRLKELGLHGTAHGITSLYNASIIGNWMCSTLEVLEISQGYIMPHFLSCIGVSLFLLLLYDLI